ncbi:hypothetical protein GmHk_10G028634 [Glycine max]|nr:hypothetical protein GmHk_10G028634 [Glycine max]
MVGQGGKALESAGSPYFVQVHSKHSFQSYGLPPNYTPPNVAHTPNENVDNSAPIPIESQQPQSGHAHVSQPMGEAHNVPRGHALANFKPHLGHATEGQAFCGEPLPNTLGGPQYRPQSQPLHFAVGRVPPGMGFGISSSTPMMEREMITMIVDTLLVSYHEKMVGYTPSSFADLVFVSKRIKVGLRKGKFDYPALMNRKPGANGKNKKEGETRVVAGVPTWPNFPLAEQYQYSANISPSYYPPPYQPRMPNHPQRPSPNRPQNSPDGDPRPNTTPNTNQNTNQGRNFPMPYADLLPYLLDNAMAVISPTKISQPSFPRGYNPNVTCAYHWGVPGIPLRIV